MNKYIGVRIFKITEDGDKVIVDLYGGPESAIGTLTFIWPDIYERMSRLEIIRKWERDKTAVDAFVSDENMWSIIESEQL